MKKTIFRSIYFIVVFIVSCLIISKVISHGNTDITMEMADPTYPIVSFEIGEEGVNELHGYAKAMDCSSIRNTILPIGSDRNVQFKIERYGNECASIVFEVRSIDGERLVESTDVADYVQVGEYIKGSFVLKDLIEPQKEYMLVLITTLDNGKEVRYYTRIVQTEEVYLEEKLAYIREFHNNTFRKERLSELSKYMETNVKGDNSTLAKVNIHSNLQQVGYANMEVTKVGDPLINIKEIDAQTGAFELNYILAADYYRHKSFFYMNEKYRIRYTADRIYLLDFERTMDHVFDEDANVFKNDKIDLGITDQNVELKESDGGNVFAFETKGRLYAYNVADQKLAKLFSFGTDKILDKRANYLHHDIKILNVDETGNVEFMVYGYMNRGRHEGHVGLAIYTYNSMTNIVEENCYVDYDKSYEMLKAEVEELSYISRAGIAYIMLDGTVYAFDLQNHTYEVMTTALMHGNYQVSKSHKMLVYQEEANLYGSSTLTLRDLLDGSYQRISAGNGNYIMPLGFMGEDLVYGLARKNDVKLDQKGNTIFPIYELRIQNSRGQRLKTYQINNRYIMKWEFVGNQLQFDLATRDERGMFVDIAGDQIVSAEDAKSGNNVLCTAITDDYEQIVQIQMKKETDSKSVKFLSPKELIYEGERAFQMEAAKQEEPRYYVYNLYGIQGIFMNPGEAVSLANECAGVVVSEPAGNDVWRRGNLVARNQIMAIKATEAVDATEALATCLDTILRYNGVSTNTQVLLEQGSTVLQILENNMYHATILELTGCSLESVLYYVNQDIPVLVLLKDGTAVVVTGFNESQVVILNPVRGELYKMGKSEAATWFEENGNNFITYIPNAD